MLMNMTVGPDRINYPLARQALTGTLTPQNLKKIITTDLQNTSTACRLPPYEAASSGGWRKKIATRIRGTR